MASKQFLRQLFQAHLSDLKSVRPEIGGDVFVCPICFTPFREIDIDNESLTDGHVWPEYIRAQSELAVNQHVLLCRRCNHTAGSRGDKQMQLMEMVRKGDDKGELYGERRVQLIQSPGESPIEITVSVQMKGKKEITVRGHWKRSDPKERERFETLVDQQRPFSIVVQPYHELNPNLTRVGWVTSAYLFAFFTLGYRYIFHESITPVREYILRSFDEQFNEHSEQPASGGFGIREYYSQVFPHPEIVLAVPVDGKTFVHLEVNCLRYQISLPLHFVPSVLSQLIYHAMLDFNERLPEILTAGGYFYSPIVCSKQDDHECIYDYLMGKPMPASSQ